MNGILTFVQHSMAHNRRRHYTPLCFAPPVGPIILRLNVYMGNVNTFIFKKVKGPGFNCLKDYQTII